tara:strand:- start:2582 stop:2863 length:282 start_codon:yes stop_codon:yes gene_type:complete
MGNLNDLIIQKARPLPIIIFGGADDNGENAMDVAWGKLMSIMLVNAIIFYLLDYLRKILIGETNQHWAVKLIIVLGISIVLPFIIFWFTPLAG